MFKRTILAGALAVGMLAALCGPGARAEALGVPKDRWVFPWAGAQAHSVYFSQRRDLAHAPALKRAGEALAERVGFALADAEIADLYACFPAAVELQAEALGLGLDRPLTVTGGMRFAGGPWNTYALHMVANLYLHLREAPRSRGLCCGNGGYATRFSLGVYSGSPPASGFQRIEAPFTLTPKETIALDPKPSSAVRLEAFSVGYRKDGAPERAILAGRTADDRRALAISTDAELLQALLRDEVAGLTFRCAETGEAAPV